MNRSRTALATNLFWFWTLNSLLFLETFFCYVGIVYLYVRSVSYRSKLRILNQFDSYLTTFMPLFKMKWSTWFYDFCVQWNVHTDSVNALMYWIWWNRVFSISDALLGLAVLFDQRYAIITLMKLLFRHKQVVDIKIFLLWIICAMACPHLNHKKMTSPKTYYIRFFSVLLLNDISECHSAKKYVK